MKHIEEEFIITYAGMSHMLGTVFSSNQDAMRVCFQKDNSATLQCE